MNFVPIPLPTLAATEKLATQMAPHLHKGDCIALVGDLGTGKTTFARALLRVMGVTGDVPSPTFTLVQTYEINGTEISHFDLYRLKSPDELDELGFEDALANGITLIEWPERAGGRLPPKTITLTFTLAKNNTRQCTVTGIKL